MQILRKLAAKNSALWEHPTVSIAFFGDSVTQGCFEIFKREDGCTETEFRQHEGYPHKLARILAQLYPMAPVQVINAGLSGDNAAHAFKRLERDVLRFSPDLTVVCFGLNDSMAGIDYLPTYIESLTKIFDALKNSGCEVIFMTPNRMNDKVSPKLTVDWMQEYAAKTAQNQNDGILDAFMDAARALCREKQVPVCDCYAIWTKFYENGVNIAEQMANKTNHPLEQLHWLFATELTRTIFEY